MFCTKCGNNNPDGAPFCTSCGAPLNASAAPKTSGSSFGDKMPPQVNDFINKMKNSGNDFYKKIGIAVAALVAVIIVICVIVGNTGINGTINKLERATKKYDEIAMNEVMYPKSYINDKIIDEKYDGDKGEYKTEMKEQQKEEKENAKDNDIKIVSVKKSGKIKKLNEDDYEYFGCENKSDLLEKIEEDYDIDKVKDVRKCKIKTKVKIDGEKETSTTEWVFYKVGMRWYMYQAIYDFDWDY